MGRAFQALTQYECKRAIELLSELPQHQYQTGWVLCQVARAYFELNNYIQVSIAFSQTCNGYQSFGHLLLCVCALFSFCARCITLHIRFRLQSNISVVSDIRCSQL